jgi:hypothetical protein
MLVDKTKLINDLDEHVQVIRNATASDLKQMRQYARQAKQLPSPSIYLEGMMAFLRGRVSSSKLALMHFDWLKDSYQTTEDLT